MTALMVVKAFFSPSPCKPKWPLTTPGIPLDTAAADDQTRTPNPIRTTTRRCRAM